MDKYDIKQKNMRALSDYQRRLWTDPELRYLFFELTDRCNLNCRHCGSSCTALNHTELKFEVIQKVLLSIIAVYEPRKIMVCLTGGEPLLYGELVKVVYTARKLGFPVGITTNGTLISREKALQLAHAGLNTIAVSIDGLKESHNRFRKSESFSRVLEGIHNLKEAGIEPQVITVASRENLSELEDLYQFLRKEDIYSWRLVNMDPIGRARNEEGILLDRTELLYLLRFIREKRFSDNTPMEVTYGCSHFLGYEIENEVRDFYFQCGAGTKIASIMCDGSIGACLDIERRPDLIQGNAYTDDFIQVWEQRFKPFRTDRTEKSEVCRNCSYRDVCLGDSVHTWDYDKNEPRYCMMRGGDRQ